jgi:hypothetical protein
MKRALLLVVAGLVIGLVVLGTAGAGVKTAATESETSKTNSEAKKTVTVDCPAMTSVTGGGARVVKGGKDVALTETRPRGEGWKASAVETDSRRERWTLKVFAVCS